MTQRTHLRLPTPSRHARAAVPVILGCAVLATLALAWTIHASRCGPRPATPGSGERPAPAAGAGGAAGAAGAAQGIAFYTCSMHPAVKLSVPGSCPICSMDLLAVTTEQVASGEIMVDESRRQLIGVRTALVARQPLRIPVTALGRVAYDESAFTDVSLRIGGRITRLAADATGAFIEQGQPLITLDSPELAIAEQEYLLALGRRAGALAAAGERLRRMDLSEAQIGELREHGAQRDQVIVAPASGYLIAKDVVQGATVVPGQRLFRIAPSERVWVLAEIFESDLAVVRVGQTATVTLASLPGATVTSTIDYLYPELDAGTRSVRARLRLDNADHRLRPGMFATVAIAVEVGERLLVAKSAVIYSGPRRLVFVDLGAGRLRPRQVSLGLANELFYEVLGGLAAGDRVVTSGNFLVAAESRIRSAEQYWGGENDAR